MNIPLHENRPNIHIFILNPGASRYTRPMNLPHPDAANCEPSFFHGMENIFTVFPWYGKNVSMVWKTFSLPGA